MEQLIIDLKKFGVSNTYAVLTFNSDDFNADINVDDVLKIDYANIMGELLTFSVILNRVGVLLSQIEDVLRRKQNECDNTKADLEKIKGKAYDKSYKELQEPPFNVKSPTVPQINNRLMEHQDVINKELELRNVRKELLDVQRDRDYVNNLYWACKSKNDILTKMTDKLVPNDFAREIIETRVNKVMIKLTEKLIKHV